MMAINFTDIASQLFPGALAYLVAAKLSGKEKRGWFETLMEWAVYTWLIRFFLKAYTGVVVTTEEVPVSLAKMLEGDLLSFAVVVLLAVLLGTAGGFLGRMRIEARIEKVKEGRLERMSPGKKKTAGILLWLVTLAVTLFLISLPRLIELRELSEENTYKEVVKKTFNEVRDSVEDLNNEGKVPDVFGDLDVNGITVRQVTSDQKWTKGTGKSGYEAVYMVDQNGDLVYFSFRDEDRASTWSGPTEDESFLAKNGKWNGGKGYGWSGFKISG